MKKTDPQYINLLRFLQKRKGIELIPPENEVKNEKIGINTPYKLTDTHVYELSKVYHKQGGRDYSIFSSDSTYQKYYTAFRLIATDPLTAHLIPRPLTIADYSRLQAEYNDLSDRYRALIKDYNDLLSNQPLKQPETEPIDDFNDLEIDLDLSID